LKKESPNGFNVLHYAAFQNNPKTIEILLSYGANAHQQNKQGINVIHMAA